MSVGLWVLIGVGVWLGLGVGLAVMMGRGVRLADRQAPRPSISVGVPALRLVPAVSVPAVSTAAPVRARRRVIPLPPVGVALCSVVLVLETVGYVLRLTAREGVAGRALSMDAPWSAPRMVVAALFAVSAVAAIHGAVANPRRRAWWGSVAVVAASISVVKSGSTVHASALEAVTARTGSAAALALSAVLAVGVCGLLWLSSRGDRRDRRRVLGGLGAYAVAAVGLSAISGAVASAYDGGSVWAAAATYLEEAAEGLAGVAVLVGVLVGVAPRLVLPADWALRRSADQRAVPAEQSLGAIGSRLQP